MRIEQIEKGIIEDIDTKSLHSLRLRSIQLFDKYFSDPNIDRAEGLDLSKSELLEKYSILEYEMKNRNISIPTKNIDKALFSYRMKRKKEVSKEVDITKPYPNEHSARINNPDKYKRIRRENDAFGDGIHVLWGITTNNKVEVQAIRFDSDKFTVKQAKDWLKENNYKPISFEPAKEEKSKIAIISKQNEEQIVYGIVYAPNEVDTQGDFSTEEEIRKAAYSFALNGFKMKINHRGGRILATVLESYLAPSDLTIEETPIQKGTWLLCAKIHDKDIWKKVKEGEITGFSMAGIAEVE